MLQEYDDTQMCPKQMKCTLCSLHKQYIKTMYQSGKRSYLCSLVGFITIVR